MHTYDVQGLPVALVLELPGDKPALVLGSLSPDAGEPPAHFSVPGSNVLGLCALPAVGNNAICDVGFWCCKHKQWVRYTLTRTATLEHKQTHVLAVHKNTAALVLLQDKPQRLWFRLDNQGGMHINNTALEPFPADAPSHFPDFFETRDSRKWYACFAPRTPGQTSVVRYPLNPKPQE